MRFSQYYLPTLKEAPQEAEVISHQLMLRAGLIKRVASGIYTWLPLGQRIYKKVENIVREEMNQIGALEVDMPNVQPAELWQESGRFEDYGPELLRFRDRHARDFCLGPTHEEVVTDSLKGVVTSYKQLPLTLYQIQKKFRDEVRPRFGVMRGREFIMKDAYSFHADKVSLQSTYEDMYGAYSAIFSRLGLDFRAVEADTGSIGGSASHEFHVLAETGEDFIAFSSQSDFAANIELATCVAPATSSSTSETLEKTHTPDCKTIEAVSAFLQKPAQQTIKTLLLLDEHDQLVALCLLGQHRLNDIKVEKIAGLKKPLTWATPEQIAQSLNCQVGSLGPVNFAGRIIVDHSAAATANLICGANQDDYHYLGMNWARDVSDFECADIRNIEAGDPSPDGCGEVIIRKGIEVGHIFQLGNKYSQAMSLTVLDAAGKSLFPEMGCYGIGITRIVAAAIEQNHDARGIIWPASMAPFTVVICPIGYPKSAAVREQTDQLYTTLRARGIEVALDDRDLRPGVMFAEMDLIGVPHRVVIGEKTLADGCVEYKARQAESSENRPVDEIADFLCEQLS